jgi:Ca2+-binding RTX toxin-like protein
MTMFTLAQRLFAALRTGQVATPAFASVEPMEARRFLSAAPAPAPAIDADGVLQVSGTNKSDVIVVELDASDATKLDVTVNGAMTQFDASSITGGVHVVGGNGSDDIEVHEATAGEFTLPVFFEGGNGKDTLVGGSGADNLSGGNGGDVLKGMAGDDTLAGGNGKDDLDAGDGNDTIDGGQGKDHLVGGAGADHFTGTKEAKEVSDASSEDTIDDLLDHTHGA